MDPEEVEGGRYLGISPADAKVVTVLLTRQVACAIAGLSHPANLQYEDRDNLSPDFGQADQTEDNHRNSGDFIYSAN